MSARKPISRRSFLGAAMAAAGAPYVIASSALGGTGRAPANSRIGLGFVGVGNMGLVHLENFCRNGHVQIRAVCDLQPGRCDAARAILDRDYDKAGGAKSVAFFSRHEELLARADVHAVVVAVPDHWHALLTVAACRAGKDVYCEKPLSLTVREGRAMVDAARRYGRVVQTGSQQRSGSNFRHACELVRSGYIGKVRRVHVDVGGPSRDIYLPAQPVPEGFDYDRWLGPAPLAPYNDERVSGRFDGGWRRFRDYSGGAMTDWGAHHFDIAQWGLGADAAGPVEVHPPTRQGYKSLTYRYADGVLIQRGVANGIKFVGDEGWVEVNRGFLRTHPESLARQVIGPNDVRLYRSAGHTADWIKCIHTRGRPIADVEIGHRSATVCHLGNIALWLGRPVGWDPADERIVGDAAAARRLDRPRRAPWRT